MDEEKFTISIADTRLEHWGIMATMQDTTLELLIPLNPSPHPKIKKMDIYPNN